MELTELKEKIRTIPDFPQKGVLFKDITPLLRDQKAFYFAVDQLVEEYIEKPIDVVCGIESRGFIIGSALAALLAKGFVPLRKQGKLPPSGNILTQSFHKEYGTDSLEIQNDAIEFGQRSLIVDDVLATGGTACAAAKLIKALGGKPSFCFLVEISSLHGRELLREYDVFSLLRF